jgi:hypothetical protein
MKECRDCQTEKDLNEYYKHSEMKDGHLNKCKECVKKRVHGYWEDGRGKEVDKKRNQKPARKAWQREQSKRMRKKHKKQRKCRSVFWGEFKKGTIEKLPCEKCGTKELVEAHHPNYNEPFNIMWLCCYHHKEWHRNNVAIL